MAGRRGGEDGAAGRRAGTRPRAARSRARAPDAPAARGASLGLFGHAAARAELRRARVEGRLAPVLLLAGPPGVGKESFAFWTARLLLCTAEGGGEPGERPCEGCPACVRVSALQHPDVHWFFPVPAESTPFGEGELARLLQRMRDEPLNPAPRRFAQPASFRMHQAASIRRLAATTSFEGGARVFVLGDYEQNPSDQVHNALLKVLEEPPPRTFFLLTTSRPQALPATILSRCTPVRLGPLSGEEMEAFLEAVLARLEAARAADERAALLAEAEGRPGRLLELLHAGEGAGGDAVELFRQVVGGGPLASYGYALTASLRGSREEHGRRLDALAVLWRDLLRVRAGAAERLARPDLLDLYRQAAGRLDAARGTAAALELERGREQIRSNVYAPLVFWTLFRALALALEPGPAVGAAAARRGTHAGPPAAASPRLA
jgi:DNA polymerase III subunit delta'